MEPQDAVHLGGDALVVGRDQRRAAFAADEIQEFGEDDVGGGSSRLPVGSSASTKRRAVGQRAGDRDALLLAARQFGRAMVEPLAETERGQQFGGASAGFAGSAPWMSCGRMTFSIASKSGSRWWN